LEAYTRIPAVQVFLKSRRINDNTTFVEVLDIVVRNLKKDDFIMHREYTVKALFDSPRGKWSASLSNSVFLDSKKFFSIYTNQFLDNMMDVFHREMERDPTGMTNGLSQAEFVQIQQFSEAIKLIMKNADSKEFAFFAHMKLGDPLTKYSADTDYGYKAINRLMKDSVIRHFTENEYTMASPVSTYLTSIGSSLSGSAANMLISILTMVLFLSYIVSSTRTRTQCSGHSAGTRAT
jgi:hypothetical protein